MIKRFGNDRVRTYIFPLPNSGSNPSVSGFTQLSDSQMVTATGTVITNPQFIIKQNIGGTISSNITGDFICLNTGATYQNTSSGIVVTSIGDIENIIILSGESSVIRLQNDPNFSIRSSTSTTYSYLSNLIDVTGHFLLIYNASSQDSSGIARYYIDNRPLFSGIKTLSVECDDLESWSYAAFTGFRKNVVDFITGNFPIRYVILSKGIPLKYTDVNNTITSTIYGLLNAKKDMGLVSSLSTSVINKTNPNFNLNQYSGDLALFTFLDGKTYADVSGYIDRICAGQTGLYLTGRGSKFYIDNVQGIYPAIGWMQSYASIMSGENMVYAPYTANYSDHILSGSGVAGYISWGNNGGLGGSYANNGAIKWYGNDNWYLIATAESYNMVRDTFQGNYGDWFSSGAFGGSGYENCPVGAVGHVAEPYGLVNNQYYFKLWDEGHPFIECAWASAAWSNNKTFNCIGDPLLVK